MDLITRTLALFLISCIAITLQNTQNTNNGKSSGTVFTSSKNNILRDRRGYILKRKPGPLRQIFSVLYDQWNDTRYTWSTLNNLINDQFLPENPKSTTTSTPTPNTNVTTKKPPFKIPRSEFYKILQRNLKGLMRLYNIELQDALRQSTITRKEYDRNVSREVSKFL